MSEEQRTAPPIPTGALSPIATILGWWFLPSLLSQLALRIFYTLSPSSRPVHPPLPPRPPGLPPNAPLPVDAKLHEAVESSNARTFAHQRRAQILVVAAYLLYGVVRLYLDQLGTNHFARLGLHSSALGPALVSLGDAGPSSVDLAGAADAGLKSHWRRLARVAHPDKFIAPVGATAEEAGRSRMEFEMRFLGMREAYDVLRKPNLRWAYERFGPEVVLWKDCVTPSEYMRRGLVRSSPYYVMSAAMLALTGFFLPSHTSQGSFWRWVILASSGVGEAMLVMFPPTRTLPMLFTLLFPNRLPFEQVLLLRQLALAGSCAVTHIGGALSRRRPQNGRLPWWELEGPAREKELVRTIGEWAEAAERARELGQGTVVEAQEMVKREVRVLVEGKVAVEGKRTAPAREDVEEVLRKVQKQAEAITKRQQTGPEKEETRPEKAEEKEEASTAKVKEEETEALDPRPVAARTRSRSKSVDEGVAKASSPAPTDADEDEAEKEIG